MIQCAARKQPDAGHLLTASGQPVYFVARPQIAPHQPNRLYARPDDLSNDGASWREHLLSYNANRGANPLHLYPAYELYQNRAYRRLVDQFGVSNVYILSAGWGMIAANFLTPSYDITFSSSAKAYKRRRKADPYKDFVMLPPKTRDDIVFFGGKDYLPLFCSLTKACRAKKIVFFNSSIIPRCDGYEFIRFRTNTQTNWHYQCVKAFLDGRIHT